MGWTGKIMGGVIGGLFGGPLGAVLGATAGHFAMDRGESNSSVNISSLEQRQAAYFVALFSMLAKMAKADGVISKEEIAVIDDFMKNQIQLSGESLQFARDIFREAKQSPHTFEQFAAQFAEINPDSNLLNSMLDLLFSVAASDKKLHPEELRLLKSAKEIWNIPEQLFQSMQEQYFPTTVADRYYAVLHCTAHSSDAEIKRQYRKMVTDYHPDKIVSKGLPEEFVELASKKFREIQEAYEKIREIRGF